MKIVFVITMGIDRPSGQRYFNIAKGLVALGHTVRILALHPNLERCQTKRFIRDGVEIWYLGQMHAKKQGTATVRFSPWQLLRVVFASTRGLIRGILASPADVYHLGKPQPINGLAALIGINLLRGQSFFVDCDDDEVQSNRLTSSWQRSVFAFWQRLIVERAVGSTVNTLFLRERNLSVGRGPVVYVPNGVDLERFTELPTPQVEGMQNALELMGRRVIAYVGTLSLQNHPVDLLLDAFESVYRRFPDTTLLFIGGGEDLPLMKIRAESLDLSHAVLFTGHVDQRGLPSLLALADITADPVYDDDVARARSPLKVFESLALGIPVVTGDIGDRAMLLDGGRAGALVAAGSADALAGGLMALLEDDDRRFAAGKHGQQHVRQQYAWPILASRWAAIYRHNDSPDMA